MDASFWPRLQAHLNSIHLSAGEAITYADPAALRDLDCRIRTAYRIEGSLALVDGAAQGLLVALNACRGQATHVYLPRLGFPGYVPLARAMGFEVETYEPSDYDRSQQRARRLQKSPREAAIFVISQPHNPTGLINSAEHVERLVRTAARKPSALIIDYGADFGSEAISESLQCRVGCLNLLPTMHVASLGKLLACPGLRLGAVWSLDAELVDASSAFRVHLSRSPCPMAVTLARRLLGDRSYLAELRLAVQEVQRRRRWLYETLAPKFPRMALPNAGRFVYVPGLRCTDQCGPAAVAGNLFGDLSEASVRLDTALSTSAWKNLQHHVKAQVRS
jgi:aspartate/methionine/tyrosine aminotransferase